jgi:branched-chain amino acid transport system ATP-binding protein
MTMLEVRGLHAAYDGKEALHGVSFDVALGACVCLIGANGAGKTTTMRCLSGLLRPTRGTIIFEGEDIAALSPAARVAAGVALVPEGRRVFAPMTVRENLEMGAYRRLWPRRQSTVGADFDFVFALFPRLHERLSQMAGALSGGEQQMLAVARALMLRPKLLLLDEPSMGLAPLVVKDIFATLRRLNEMGVSILLAEQNTRMALRTASRGYVLSGGLIVKAADAKTLAGESAVQNAYLGL